MKSGFQKRKDRDSRERAAIAAKSHKMTEFFEEAACKNKKGGVLLLLVKKLEQLKKLLAKIKKFAILLLLVKKLEQLKWLNKKFMKLRLRIAQYQITLLHTQRNGSCPICCATHRQHVSEKHCATRCVSTWAE